MNPHFRSLEAAYQLHYYLYFKTRYLRPMLVSDQAQSLINDVINEVCRREGYHLLKRDIADNHLRLLLSLKPSQTISSVVKMIKGNLNQQFVSTFPGILELNRSRTLWARGYFARTSGKINLERTKQYVASQTEHHGYKGAWARSLKYQNPDFKSPAFSFAHCFCQLNYHLVLATQGRTSLFDEAMAPNLFNYIIAIGEKHNFAVDRIGLLPDHVHLIIEAVPSVSIEQCIIAIMENTRHWMEKHYWGALRETDAWNVWQPSYYAGTVGEYTTAQIKRFLSER